MAAVEELRQPIIEEALRRLASQDWRGQEQAAILLTQLQHRPAAARMVQLLTADRPEVFVTVAWGLRKLAVADTLPAVTKYVRDEFERLKKSNPLPGRKTVPGELISHRSGLPVQQARRLRGVAHRH